MSDEDSKGYPIKLFSDAEWGPFEAVYNSALATRVVELARAYGGTVRNISFGGRLKLPSGDGLNEADSLIVFSFEGGLEMRIEIDNDQGTLSAELHQYQGSSVPEGLERELSSLVPFIETYEGGSADEGQLQETPGKYWQENRMS